VWNRFGDNDFSRMGVMLNLNRVSFLFYFYFFITKK
jgi:hypothetical protein